MRGHKLLKDKRDELLRQFMDLVKENMELRKKVEAGLKSANMEFAIAKAGMSKEVLNTALLASKKSLEIDEGEQNVMSVDIPVFSVTTRTSEASDIYSYGFASTSFELDDAVDEVAQNVGQVLIGRRLELLPGKGRVGMLRPIGRQVPAPIVGGQKLKRLIHEDAPVH